VVAISAHVLTQVSVAAALTKHEGLGVNA